MDSLCSSRKRYPVFNSLAESSWVTVCATGRDLILGAIFLSPDSTEHINTAPIGVIERFDSYQLMYIVLMSNLNVLRSNLNLFAQTGDAFAENLQLVTSKAKLEKHLQGFTRWGPDATRPGLD